MLCKYFCKVHGTIAVVFHPVVKSQNNYDRNVFLKSWKRCNSALLNTQLLNNIMFLRCIYMFIRFK